jgi:cytochrome b561
LARWERASAALSHWLLYLIMLGMPLSGYLFSAWGGHAVNYFGLFTLPSLVKNDTPQQVAFWAHVAIGQWMTYAVILLHIGATGLARGGTPGWRAVPHAAGAKGCN